MYSLLYNANGLIACWIFFQEVVVYDVIKEGSAMACYIISYLVKMGGSRSVNPPACQMQPLVCLAMRGTTRRTSLFFQHLGLFGYGARFIHQPEFVNLVEICNCTYLRIYLHISYHIVCLYIYMFIQHLYIYMYNINKYKYKYEYKQKYKYSCNINVNI